MGNFVGPHVAVWNTFFALIQLVIGLGLLFHRSVRPALVVSFAWAFGVWFFGEGLGMILTGCVSPHGAPGSVFLYGLIGLMAWPLSAPADEGEETEPSVGLESSAAGRGIGGAVTPSLVWCGYWSLAAILFLLPNNRTPTSVSRAITGMASGNPSWYAHFLNSFGNGCRQRQRGTSWVLAIGSLVIGFGPLVFRGPRRSSLPAACWGRSSGSAARVSEASFRLGDRAQYRSAARGLGAGHDAGLLSDPRSWLSAVLDCDRRHAPGLDRAGPGVPPGRALLQRRLPGRRPGVEQRGHERHVRDVEGMTTRIQDP